ncbi:DSBA-like thioredoxin domain protein [Candidatus Nitrosopumilus salaria BD31]|jgi:protein-disulfide isomerase|uniref:DSBA-like thioredoxin domain protein n=1 Tax=Candidatus Nitrosopumilus salarius BD31 TaxID=859350 RepID=I3D5I9_9ARCH|nr:DsbA family protein [Candidatus Nitrosopumilus salaria]EIJ66982.1 DSBA-like thioredoxin domain protein [Candidatus Nitrosopumilus salaria BD31]
MSSEDFESSQDSQNISVKKSTFNGLIIALIAIVGVAAFFAGSYTSLNSNQISEEDLDDAIAKLELKMLQNQLPSKQANPPIKISIDNDPIIGNPDAPITIIEFSDFQCPFCARFHTQTLPLIMNEYIQEGKVKLVFRDFPIQNIHPNALPASVAAECANEQSKFKEMHDALFENQDEWNNQETADALALFSQYATEIKLDQEVFDACLTSGKYIEEIRNDLEDGRDYGVSGTPGFFVGNDQIGYVELKGAQPFESFKKIIDTQLEA